MAVSLADSWVGLMDASSVALKVVWSAVLMGMKLVVCWAGCLAASKGVMWVDRKDALKVVHSVVRLVGQMVPLLASCLAVHWVAL